MKFAITRASFVKCSGRQAITCKKCCEKHALFIKCISCNSIANENDLIGSGIFEWIEIVYSWVLKCIFKETFEDRKDWKYQNILSDYDI